MMNRISDIQYSFDKQVKVLPYTVIVVVIVQKNDFILLMCMLFGFSMCEFRVAVI